VREQVFGTAVTPDPWDEQGLIGTVEFARVREAGEEPALIDGDRVTVSAGFAIGRRDDERHGTHVRVRGAIDHVALVPYPPSEIARVNAVRTGLANFLLPEPYGAAVCDQEADHDDYASDRLHWPKFWQAAAGVPMTRMSQFVVTTPCLMERRPGVPSPF
jgi:hypothetical protein